MLGGGIMSEVREFACPKCGTRIERATQQASVYEMCPSCNRMRAFSTPEVDNTPYGVELASRVARHLERGGEIAHNHQGYCGHGLGLRDGQFLYVDMGVGGADPFQYPTRALERFADRDAFISWLAQQSDDTMCGWGEDTIGNQRITRSRLLEALCADAGPT